MARLPRLFLPNVPMHVTVRGIDRQAMFAGDGDRLAFLHCLREAAEKQGLAIHSYVLMTNHVHLLASGPEKCCLARTIQAVGRKYVPRFNRRRQRTGTLWESRHRSSPVESERYALACHRYIDLNPVRAAMVPEPAAFIWSSYLHHAHGKPDDLISPHETYVSLGADEMARRTAYRALCEEVLPEETVERIRRACHRGWPIGSDDFCRRVETLTGRRAMPAAKGRPPRPK
jgi:putative transposase